MVNFDQLKAGFNQFYPAGRTFYILAGFLATLSTIIASFYTHLIDGDVFGHPAPEKLNVNIGYNDTHYFHDC